MTRFPLVHRLIGRFRAVGKDRRAAAAVELALAMPALCLFIFGIIEVAYALWIQNALDYSAATAARCASLNLAGSSCVGSPSQVTTYAASQSGAYGFDSTAFSYTRGTRCCVTANYTIALDIPWDSALSVALTSNACFAPPPSKNCAT